MNNLGVKNITNSLGSVVQPKCATAREKGIRVEVDDDVKYNPSESEDDNDDESLGSFDREVLYTFYICEWTCLLLFTFLLHISYTSYLL